MKALAAAWKSRTRRLNITRPVEMLVISYNSTLRGYIEELASREITADGLLNLRVKTFAGWAKDAVNMTVNHDAAMSMLKRLSQRFSTQTSISFLRNLSMS